MVSASSGASVSADAGRWDSVRRATTLRAATLITPRQKQPCLVRNLSARGVRLRVFRKLKVGAQAVLEFRSGLHVSGRISWARHGHIGFGFDEALDVETALSTETASPQGYRSRLPRVECRRPVIVRSGTELIRGHSVDLSQGGIKIETRVPVAPGPVIVTLPGLFPVRGCIRWSDGHFAGVAFNQILPLRRIAEWTGGEAEIDRHLAEPNLARLQEARTIRG